MNKKVIEFFKQQLEKAGYIIFEAEKHRHIPSELRIPRSYKLSETDRTKLNDLMQFGYISKENPDEKMSFGHFILGDLSVLVGRCGIGKTTFVQQAIKQLRPEKRIIVFSGDGEEYARLAEVKPCIECYSMEDIVESPVEFATSEDWKREPKEIYLEKLMSTKGVELVFIEADQLFSLDNHTLNLIISLSVGCGVRTCLVTSDLYVIPKLFELGNVDLSKLTMTVEGLLND